MNFENSLYKKILKEVEQGVWTERTKSYYPTGKNIELFNTLVAFWLTMEMLFESSHSLTYKLLILSAADLVDTQKIKPSTNINWRKDVYFFEKELAKGLKAPVFSEAASSWGVENAVIINRVTAAMSSILVQGEIIIKDFVKFPEASLRILNIKK